MSGKDQQPLPNIQERLLSGPAVASLAILLTSIATLGGSASWGFIAANMLLLAGLFLSAIGLMLYWAITEDDKHSVKQSGKKLGFLTVVGGFHSLAGIALILYNLNPAYLAALAYTGVLTLLAWQYGHVALKSDR